MNRIRSGLLLLVVLFCAVSCAPKAKIATSWIDPTMRGYRVDKVLVLGVARSEAHLKLWETVFAEHLEKAGVRAMESNRVIGITPEPDRTTVEAAVMKTGATSVLITHLVNHSSSTYTHPGTIHYVPTAAYGLYGYYGSVYRAVYTPPVDSTTTTVQLESNLYDVTTARLVWSARSDVLNPKLLRSDYDRVVGQLVGDMRAKGLL